MEILSLVFWIAFAVVFYSFVGYGALMLVLVKIKKVLFRGMPLDPSYEPEVTLVIPCYNEADIIDEKIDNSMRLDYPRHKLSLVFITDGSTDHSLEVLKKYPHVRVLHSERRAGKTAAENRAMQFITSP